MGYIMASCMWIKIQTHTSSIFISFSPHQNNLSGFKISFLLKILMFRNLKWTFGLCREEHCGSRFSFIECVFITQCSIGGSFYGAVLKGLAFLLFYSACYTSCRDFCVHVKLLQRFCFSWSTAKLFGARTVTCGYTVPCTARICRATLA